MPSSTSYLVPARSDIQRQLESDALSSLRWRTLTCGFVLAGVIPQFKSIFQSMNVQLPLITRAILGLSDMADDWGIYLLIPMIGAWVLLERSVFPHLSYSGLRFLARMCLVGLVVCGWFIYSPMQWLIGNVG